LGHDREHKPQEKRHHEVETEGSQGTKFSCEDSIGFVEESQTVGFAIVDLDGMFLCVNPAYCKVLNATWRQIVGTHYKDWTHDSDVAADIAAATELADGKAMRYGMFKRYIQRGSTVKNPREVAGFLEVEAIWKDGKCHRYRVKFTPYGPMEQSRTTSVALIREVLPVAIQNWKYLAIAGLTLLSIFGGSELVTKLLSAIATVRGGLDTQPSH